MADFYVEFKDPKDLGNTEHSMPTFLLTIQGNREGIHEMIKFLETQYVKVKEVERKCDWLERGVKV
jgi:hypothetical protein